MTLEPWVEDLDPNDPVRAFLTAMGRCASETELGWIPGPFSEAVFLAFVRGAMTSADCGEVLARVATAQPPSDFLAMKRPSAA